MEFILIIAILVKLIMNFWKALAFAKKVTIIMSQYINALNAKFNIVSIVLIQ